MKHIHELDYEYSLEVELEQHSSCLSQRNALLKNAILIFVKTIYLT